MTDEILIDETVDNAEPLSRRDEMAALFDKAESGEPVAVDRPRDEKGKFAQKAEKVEPEVVAPVVAPEPKPSLTTWRKEYLPIQDKLDKGVSLTADEAKKLAAYNVEREKQYSSGISTYKTEAAEAKEYKDAMAEFLPLLQQHNMKPTAWIQNLGRAHVQLVRGTPEQKIQMFTKIAQDYGIPIGALGQAQSGQLDPVSMQLMKEIQDLKQGVSGIANWRQQQEEQVLQQEVAKFTDAARYPHFGQVRESMIQLLESGVAQNPDEAYKKAVRLDESIQTAPLAPTVPNVQKAAVAKAKATSGQVRGAAPRATQNPINAAKDRRSALADAFAAADNGHI